MAVPGLRAQHAAEPAARRLALRPPSTQEACPEGRIDRILVDNHSIFDLDDPALSPELRWAYGLANSLHIRTRESLIRRELLFSAGDCFDPLLVRESERLLRGYDFIARAEVISHRQPDGDHEVFVDTRDEWTTKVDVRFVVDDGFEFRGVDITEENFLGRGMTLGAFFLEREETQDAGVRFGTPQLFGSRWKSELTVGRTRVGSLFEEEISHPFVAEVGRWAVREGFDFRESQFAYAQDPTAAVPGTEEFSHVLLPMERERFDVTVAGRFGEPGGYTIFGGALSLETLEFPRIPEEIEVVRNRGFGDAEPAPAELRPIVLPHATPFSSVRLNLLFGRRAVRFETFRGLDALGGVQDVALGSEVEVNVGRSIGSASGEDGLAETDDLAAGAKLYAAGAPGDFVLAGNLLLEARRIFGGQEGGRGWRDVLGEVDLLGYWTPDFVEGSTLMARLSGAGGWSTVTPFQLTLGGLRGVRGYRDERFPGARRVVGTLEERVYLPWPAPSLLDFGATLFADVGRIWDGGVPFGVDSGWKGSVGAGIRIGFPPGTQRTVRADLAFPLRGGVDGRNPIFRVTFLELVGLLPGFRDPQLERSRHNPVGSEFLTFPR